MRQFCVSLVLLAVLAAGAARAEVQSSKNSDLDSQLKQIAQSQVLTMLCPVPGIQPKLIPSLKRSQSVNSSQLIESFLGGSEGLIGGDEAIVSPIWGRGQRHKSGSVVYALPEDRPSVLDPRKLPKAESVPAYLDIYQPGFIYSNTVSHKAVRATELGPTSAKQRVSYHNLYSEADGQAAAEQLIGRMAGQLKVPKGFRRSTQQQIQTFGEKLYAYRTTLEYLTSYTVYKTVDGKRQAAREQAVAVPVLDNYVHVLLDGDKLLVGMENFWDNGLSLQGQPKECIQAGEAVIKAQAWLLKSYGETHPLMNVSNLRLGYVQDRHNPSQLVPAWVFDAWYTSVGKGASNITTGENSGETVSAPFAVNALTGEVVDL